MLGEQLNETAKSDSDSLLTSIRGPQDKTAAPQLERYPDTDKLAEPEAFSLFCGMLLAGMDLQAVALKRHGDFRHTCQDGDERFLLARDPLV